MNRENTFIPISEVRHDRIRFDLELPKFVPLDEIGINIGRIEALMQWGGIAALKVSTKIGPAIESATPTIVGMTKNGEALAGKVAKSKTPPFSSETMRGFSPNHSDPGVLATRWIISEIDIDPREISRQISQDKRWLTGVRSPEAWTHFIDYALRTGLSKAGSDHLVHGARMVEKANSAFWSFIQILNGVSNTLTSDLMTREPNNVLPHLAYNIATSLLFWHLAMNGLIFASSKIANPKVNYRPSLFFGFQIDRAIVLKILAGTQPVSKRIPKKI